MPLSGFTAEHNFHHSHIQGMFGLYFPWFWDALCGTDKHWLKFRDNSEQTRLEEIAKSVEALSRAEIKSE